jgi:hypothetical protein
VFEEAGLVSVYYLPGARNWPSRLNDRPVLLWDPEIVRGGLHLGTGGSFAMQITATTNIPVVVETSTNVSGAAWLPLASNTVSGGCCVVADPQWTDHAHRFYRIAWPF